MLWTIFVQYQKNRLLVGRFWSVGGVGVVVVVRGRRKFVGGRRSFMRGKHKLVLKKTLFCLF